MNSSTFSKMYPCQLQLSGEDLAPFKTASDSRVSSHNWSSKLEAREGKQARGYFLKFQLCRTQVSRKSLRRWGSSSLTVPFLCRLKLDQKSNMQAIHPSIWCPVHWYSPAGGKPNPQTNKAVSRLSMHRLLFSVEGNQRRLKCDCFVARPCQLVTMQLRKV